jgi:hypothetical protein
MLFGANRNDLKIFTAAFAQADIYLVALLTLSLNGSSQVVLSINQASARLS